MDIKEIIELSKSRTLSEKEVDDVIKWLNERTEKDERRSLITHRFLDRSYSI